MAKTREQYNAYMRGYMLRRYRTWRADAIAQLGGCCAQCGSIDRMEFDHVDPATKAFTIGTSWSTSRAKLDAELAKCQLLCFGCHRRKSGDELSVEHGEGKTGKRNCRCDLCSPLKREYQRAGNWRASRIDAPL